MDWFDTHCHLDDQRYADDRQDVVSRARAAGVSRCVTINCAQSVEALSSGVTLAEALDPWTNAEAREGGQRVSSVEPSPLRIYATVGVHPHDAKHWVDESTLRPSPAWSEAFAEMAAHTRVVALGETGLDYHYTHSSREAQQRAFRLAISLAKLVKKPLVVHTRNAAEDTLRILREEGAKAVGGIIHCFSEDTGFAHAALDMGFVSSFSGIVTFKKAEAIAEAARRQPLDALLVETDAPYLAPMPHRGKRNEPAFVAHVGEYIAKLRGVSREVLAEATTLNACRVFSLQH